MELNDTNLQALAGYLQKTFCPDVNERRAAEKFLESVEGNQNYPILLLHLVDKADADITVRVAAAITFKNYIKRNWRIVEDEPNKVHEPDRLAVKREIVGLMLRMPEQIQRQLSDAITIIGREDFPSKWPDLVNEMVTKFQSGDFHVINGVLRTAHSIFKRYRHEFKSNELWTEIKYVLDSFAAPLMELFKATMEMANKYSADPTALKVIFSSLILIAKIFYSLNFQDLPEFFEDNMQTWMTGFHTLLQVDNKLLMTDDEGEAGCLELIKSQICDNVALYAQKYDEEFQPYLPQFVTAIWHLLITTGQQVKFDLLVSNAIGFLASVCERPHYKHLFEDPSTLSSICEKVIIPNMEFRDSDQELFEDDPEEYIRRDLEGSDIDTRRRAACDLVRGLCKFFEGPVIQTFSAYVAAMLAEHAKHPAQNWRKKDAAIYLVTSLASKAQTAKLGSTQASELVNLTDFFTNHIATELQASNVNEQAVLRADAIKYVTTFRTHLSHEHLKACLPLLISHLCAESVVVHTYAAHCLERLFTAKVNGKPVIIKADVDPITVPLLTNLFNAFALPGSQENEYVMKTVLRTFSLLQESVIAFLPTLLPKLMEKLAAVSKNPSKPHFNHYLFETLGLATRITCKINHTAVTSFEEAFFPPFQEILQQDVQEFIPYVFQIMSLLLEIRTDGIPESYMALFPHLLMPVLWERSGNIPPLVRLLQAYLQKGAQTVAAAEKIPSILGVFQKLIASKANDHEGFYLLDSLIEHMPEANLSSYMKQIFLLLFQRLQSSKTTKFIKSMRCHCNPYRQTWHFINGTGLLVFFCLYSIKYSASSLVQMVDGIQPKMFGMVLEKLFLQDVQKVSGHTERKICAVGMTKLLTDCPAMMEEYQTQWPSLNPDGGRLPLPATYDVLLKSSPQESRVVRKECISHLTKAKDSAENSWTPLLQALIGLFELPEDDSVPDDEHFIEIEDTPGYQTAYSRLVFSGKSDHDPLTATVAEPKIFLAQSLHKLCATYVGKIPVMISSGLDAKATQYLQSYLQAANVALM